MITGKLWEKKSRKAPERAGEKLKRNRRKAIIKIYLSKCKTSKYRLPEG